MMFQDDDDDYDELLLYASSAPPNPVNTVQVPLNIKQYLNYSTELPIIKIPRRVWMENVKSESDSGTILKPQPQEEIGTNIR